MSTRIITYNAAVEPNGNVVVYEEITKSRRISTHQSSALRVIKESAAKTLGISVGAISDLDVAEALRLMYVRHDGYGRDFPTPLDEQRAIEGHMRGKLFEEGIWKEGEGKG